MHEKKETDTVEVRASAPLGVERPRPSSARVEVEVGARSHLGNVRPNNEDHYLVARYSRSMVPLLTNIAGPEMSERFDEVGHALVVADGMGGTAGGEVASRLAIALAVNLSLQQPSWQLSATEKEGRELMQRLEERVQAINHALFERSHADPALAGMGTTLTGAYSIGADLFLCHIGDSRAYLFRKGKLEQLTHDHTLAQALADSGQIAPEEVSTHPHRHVLTNALGGHAENLLIEARHLRLEDGDRLLLCSDGLYEMVPDAQIADVLRGPGPAQAACDALVGLALERGGKDNVTVVLAHYSIPQGEAAPVEKRGEA